mgnify:CR=1 FL=1
MAINNNCCNIITNIRINRSIYKISYSVILYKILHRNKYNCKTNFNVYNNKAYLNVPAAQGARSLTIRFEGDGSTGVDMTTDNSQQTTVIYDLQGRRVENPTKGIYIVNGKKIIK